MRYLIFAKGGIESEIGSLLAQKIAVRDLSAEITQSHEVKNVRSLLVQEQFDFFIEVAPTPTVSLFKKGRKKQVHTCFIWNSVLSEDRSISRSLTADLIYTDLPFSISRVRFVGSPLFDLVKARLPAIDPAPVSRLLIGILTDKNTLPLARVLSKKLTKTGTAEVEIAIVSRQFDHAISILSKSNVCFVFNDLSQLVAAYLNCPAVRIDRNSIFSRRGKSLAGEMIDKINLPRYKPRKLRLAIAEAKRLVEDHQYCADMLVRYQIVKNRLGGSSAIKKIVEELLEMMN
ncbi:MAG: hypothetical protein AAF616_08285 [Bacteroidota bacterium]